MNLSEARQMLLGTTRIELRDHAFGDREVEWVVNGKVIASGYFGHGNGTVSIVDHITQQPRETFVGDNARVLLECGKLQIERNDETGPDEFVEGHIEPGLTKKAVLEEITRHPSNPKKES